MREWHCSSAALTLSGYIVSKELDRYYCLKIKNKKNGRLRREPLTQQGKEQEKRKTAEKK